MEERPRGTKWELQLLRLTIAKSTHKFIMAIRDGGKANDPDRRN